MKNVTISMDEQLLRLTRVEAAKAGMSTSKFIAEIVESALASKPAATSGKNPQLEALERILAGPQWDVTENGRMPTSEERNARR